jgi:hypothetical protein
MKKFYYLIFAALIALAGCSGGGDDSEILDKDNPQEEVGNNGNKEDEPQDDKEDEPQDDKEDEPQGDKEDEPQEEDEVKNNINPENYEQRLL